MESSEGFHRVTVRHDAQGNPVERSYFDAKGEPTTLMPDARVHRIAFRYDGSGHPIEEAYFDAAGKPALGTNGIHKIVRLFDGYGNITESSFFDQQGEPATVFGKHRIVSLYNSIDFVNEYYFDAKDQPVVWNGISGRRKTFDKIEMLDQKGTPTSTIGVIAVSTAPFTGGRGEAVGLRAGDIILAYGDWRFPFDRDDVDWNQACDALIAAISAPGETPRRLVILRDGHLVELSVTAGALQIRLANEPSATSWLRAIAKQLN